MSDFGGSSTPKNLRDLWRTPVEIFNALDMEFGFYLDAAASFENTLCSHFINEKTDALRAEWISYGAIWVNPPYSDITPWVLKAAEECRRQHQEVVMLVPADISVGWFSLALRSVDEVRFITDGRIQFIPEQDTGRRLSNPKGSMLFIWRPFINPRCQFTTVARDELMRIGSEVNENAD
ncbi:phage N-6-adenine-methyltransferase [Enterobacter kobei]|nr:phage N-6-adenine-methyltransferase [Enterobacter kobei]